MPNTRNALEELAERLDRVGVELCNDFLDADSKDAIHKARRIVAELAKVPNISIIPIWNCRELEAIRKCREIAEEGEKDGK